MTTLRPEDIPRFIPTDIPRFLPLPPVPDLIICHPDDLDKLQEEMAGIDAFENTMLKSHSDVEPGQVYVIRLPAKYKVTR